MARLPSRHRGAALMALLAIVVVGASYLLVSHLNRPGGFTAAKSERNGHVLNQAKQALIGHVAQLAAQQGEDNPGRLPCPEAPGNFGTTNEGIAAGNCTLPAIGRLPWRTLGLDKQVDAAGEPLWYVVSPGWALSNSTTPPLTTYLNSNSTGSLTVDASANDSVALIIAPGPAFSVSAAATCTAWSQARPTSGTPDRRNYLECENATGTTFVTRGPSGSFNDQVVRVTTADILPAIEAAIAHRIERDIAPQLKQVYTAANGWERSPGVALPAGASVFPFAAALNDPEAVIDPDPDALRPDRAVFKGAPGTSEGLPPLARHVPGTITWINPTTSFTLTLLDSNGAVSTVDCSTSTATIFRCSIIYLVAPTMAFDITAANIGTGFREAPGIASNLVITPGLGSATGSVTNWLRADGSAGVRITLVPTVPLGLTGSFTFQLTINGADHSVVNDIATTNAWYLRNEWFKLSLYAVSQGYSPASAAACGGANPPCLAIQDARYAATSQHAIMVLAGRPLPALGQTRPSASLASYLEGENLSISDQTFRRGASARTINDRVVTISQ